DISLSYNDRGSSRSFGAAGGLSLPNGGPSGNDPIDTVLAPNAHVVAWLPDGRTALSLSLNAPFGLDVEYPADWFGRYDSITSKLPTINLQGAVSQRLTDWASLSIGLDIQNAYATLTNALPNQLNPLTGQPLPDGILRLSGNDMELGWNAGGLFTPCPG